MSIVEKASEISENNVTIAKNQQRVYEAGVRAGLAQDPDYAEGFADGHEQGLSDASGVIWEDLLSGEIPVGKAREADHAAEATHSINADRAALADKATEADHSATSTNANRSANADRAAEADHADTATNATHADRATNADNADRSDFAGHATTATQATSATTADIAKALDGVLPVANGGTGAGTVDGALAALGLTGVAEIAVGTYEGNGISGASDPTTIELPFVPKLVYVAKRYTVRVNYNYDGTEVQSTETAYPGKDGLTNSFLWISGITTVNLQNEGYLRFVQAGKSLSWHDNVKSDNGENQFNYFERTLRDHATLGAVLASESTSYYTYFAIGFANE